MFTREKSVRLQFNVSLDRFFEPKTSVIFLVTVIITNNLQIHFVFVDFKVFNFAP